MPETAQVSNCPNCGYAFADHLSHLERIYVACPNCGHRLDPPVKVGRKDESTAAPKPYIPLVEGSDD